MPDPTVAVALVLLVALVEATPAVRVPVGLLLAIALLASSAELLPIALLGALGVVVARLSLALSARSGRDRLRPPSPAVQAQREALRAHLASSPAYARTTFVLAALPGVPAGFVFPLLGAMRAPLGPALAGTLVGRIPVLAITAAVFTWLGRLLTDGDDEAAVLLGVFAILLLVMRTVTSIDWEHRAATGEWRTRANADPFIAMSARMGHASHATDRPPSGEHGASSVDESDVVEGELLGEELDPDDDAPPGSLPPSSGSGS